MLEPLEHVFKQRKQLNISPEPNDGFLLGHFQFFKIDGDVRTDGVKPMNRPRQLLSGTINMRCGGRNHEELILSQFVPASRHFAPAAAARAINEHCFRAALLSRAFVAESAGIKSCIRR